MAVKTIRLSHLIYPLLVLALTAMHSAPARADFLDDVRRTFKSDIPHFFQDDIPCAFGGQPTSHTKTSCKSAKSTPPARPRGHKTPADR